MTMIGVDVGGTFTDVVSTESGRIVTVKVPTVGTHTEQGVLQGAAEVGVEDATVFNHASTHGLNAVITRNLPKIAFVTTMGHRDILDAGRTIRPAEALTDPHWRRSFGDTGKPLVARYLRRGIEERIDAKGHVLIPLSEAHVREQLRVVGDCGVEGIAVCLLNAYVNDTHEQRVRELVREELGDIPCSISSEVSPLAKEYARASTTTIDVFMKLIYSDYADRLSSGLDERGFRGDLNFANCAAQLRPVDVAIQRPFEIVFSGPAAGTVASAHFGRMIGGSNLICTDVGGTSCDISLVQDGKPLVDTTFELEHDLIVNALSNKVASIGAGGGSLVTVSAAGDLQVGPGSAGSDPGPACYGRGGRQPTTTDTCLLMGVIDPKTFAGGRMHLDAQLSLKAFDELDSPLPVDKRIQYAFNVGINNIAEGVINIAIKNGIDSRDFSLVAFGAAGPMLLPATLDLVNAKEVIVPPHPGLFSALGLISSDQVYADSRSAYTVLESSAAVSINEVYTQMEEGLQRQLGGVDVQFQRSFDGLLVGQSWETPFIPVPPGPITPEVIDEMITRFHDAYEKRTGNRFTTLPVQGVTYRVEAVVKSEKVDFPTLSPRVTGQPEPSGTIDLQYLQATPITAQVFDRDTLMMGDVINGPVIVRESLSTTFVLPGQRVQVGEYGELHITRSPAGVEGEKR